MTLTNFLWAVIICLCVGLVFIETGRLNAAQSENFELKQAVASCK